MELLSLADADSSDVDLVSSISLPETLELDTDKPCTPGKLSAAVDGTFDLKCRHERPVIDRRQLLHTLLAALQVSFCYFFYDFHNFIVLLFTANHGCR